MRSLNLSIIVPTPDGGSLDRLAASLKGQLYPEDELLVIGDTTDGALPEVEAWVKQQPQWRYLDAGSTEHSWGHREINYGMTQATGDYILFQDDDDVYARGAIVNVHRAIRRAPLAPHLFRFQAARAGGRVYWTKKGSVVCGEIGGHCMVVPNVQEKLGKWTDAYTGDYDFIVETLRLWEPIAPVWREEVIVLAR